MITNQRKTIGVFMNRADTDFQAIAQQITQKKAREMGYDVFYFFTVGYRDSVNHYDEQEKGMFAFAPVERLDGILVMPDSYDMPGFREALLDMLENRVKCPIVCVRDSRIQYDSVYTNDNDAIRPLLAHLMDDHGYRKICFQAGYEGHPDSETRLLCYREEMEKRNIPLPPNAIYYGSMWTKGADLAYDYFLGDDRERWPEAIVCANDYMAYALIEEVFAHGYSVPEDVVITGFDNVQNVSLSRITLTTVGQDYTGMLETAMQMLDQRIQAVSRGESILPHQHVKLPGSFQVRHSCGCKGPDEEEDQYLKIRNFNQTLRGIRQREVSQTYFCIELNAAETYESIHETVMRKLGDTPTMRDFYLCLFEDENGFAEKITPDVRLISCVQDRQDHGVPNIRFNRECILPSIAERADEPQAFYIHLLHQRESTFGYTVMQLQDGETPSMFYMHWNIIISIALRNLSSQFKLEALYEERRRSSITDVLTGIYNRRGFEEQLNEHWKQMCAEHKKVCLLSLDLDNLKAINDTYGHQAGGDLALKTIANAILAAAPEGAISARVGGDEYWVFIPDCGEEGARHFREKFEAYLKEFNKTARFTVGASVGAALFELGEGLTMGQCIHESDEILYQEKKRRHAELKRHAQIIGANHAKE